MNCKNNNQKNKIKFENLGANSCMVYMIKYIIRGHYQEGGLGGVILSALQEVSVGRLTQSYFPISYSILRLAVN